MFFLLGIIFFVVIPAMLVLELIRTAYLELRSDRVPILLYHRLISRASVEAGLVRDDEPIYAAYDDRFEAHMQHLAGHGYTTLSLDELLLIRRGHAPKPPKPVVITFDDGYTSNYTLAFPVLRRLKHKATIFVAPEPDLHTREQVAGIDNFLTRDQMRELDGHGVAIESHTMTHCILNELPDDRAMWELTESKRWLTDAVGRPVRHLAIPRAGYSRRIRRLAMDAGYASVCCNNKGSSNGLSDVYGLPRIVIERDTTLDDFAAALRPRSSIALRLVGNVKRIPERLFGARRARAMRRWLYGGPLAGLFVTRRLKRALAAAALLYIAVCSAFYYQWLLH